MPIPKGFRERAGDISKSRCSPGSIRTKVISRNKRLLVCCPRGQFRHGRCRNGTRAFAILTRAAK